jgi:hypothetical protein
MAVSGTYKTYDQVGKKEDVEDIIYDISPTETPFLSSIGSGTATATLHQWQQDSLAAVATNAAVEGADAGTSSVDETVLKTNNTQIFTKVVQVSGTAEAVGKYGRTSELAYQIAKKGKEMKRDIRLELQERALLLVSSLQLRTRSRQPRPTTTAVRTVLSPKLSC